MSEWREYKLGNVAELYDGPHATPAKTESGAVFLGISSLNKGKIDTTQLEFLSEQNYVRWTRRVAPKENDILFSYETRLGEAAMIPRGMRCCLGRRMGLLRPKLDKVVPEFLLYYYLGPMFQTVIRERTVFGTTVDRLPLIDMPEFPVYLPPLPEQRAIASVLSSLDDKIDLLNRQNKTLEAMAETLFRQWFVEEAEEDWKEGKIEDLFILQRGFDLPIQNRTDGSYPIFSASGLSGRHVEYRVKGPGVTTGRSGLLGKVFFIMEDFWPLNTSLFIKEFRVGTPLFSYFLLKTLDLESFNAGSAVPTLNRNHVHESGITIPSRTLIENFENTMMENFRKIHFNRTQIQSLQNIRNMLLPKLMCGEVRVTT